MYLKRITDDENVKQPSDDTNYSPSKDVHPELYIDPVKERKILLKFDVLFSPGILLIIRSTQSV